MSNPTTLYGFKTVGLIEGAEANFGIIRGHLSPANAHQIYQGDVAAPLAGGYYDVAAAVGGGAAIGGIFVGFEWLSVTAKMRIRDRAWLGNTADVVAGADGIACFVLVNPHQKFQVRSSGANLAYPTSIGTTINFSAGAGPGNNLVSTFGVNPADTGGASQPFKIFDIVQAPESDPTSANNEVIVVFNNLTWP